MNVKILIFNVYFLNMDIWLIIALICLKNCMCIAEICMEACLKILIQGLVFVLCYVEDGNLKYKKS